MDFEQLNTRYISTDELKSRILELENREINTNKNIINLTNVVKDLSETITKMNENIKKLEDEIKSKSNKEHQTMQLFRILKTHTDIGKEQIKKKRSRINK